MDTRSKAVNRRSRGGCEITAVALVCAVLAGCASDPAPTVRCRGPWIALPLEPAAGTPQGTTRESRLEGTEALPGSALRNAAATQVPAAPGRYPATQVPAAPGRYPATQVRPGNAVRSTEPQVPGRISYLNNPAAPQVPGRGTAASRVLHGD